MKAFLLSIVLFICSMSMKAQTLSDSLKHGGLNRTYVVHLPLHFSNSIIYPLLIALHGGFGSSTEMENHTALDVKADSSNFIVVYPQGYTGKQGVSAATWNAEGCCGASKNDNIDDVGFISALIDKLKAKYPIDAKRVFATGLSNGGMMCYRLATELSNKIAAIAPVASNMVNTASSPNKPIAILHIHSYQDKHVPYYGGLGVGFAMVNYTPVFDVLNQTWAPFLACSNKNDTIYTGSDFTHISWNKCSANSSVELYVTTDGGHSWPGSPYRGTMGVFTDTPSTAFSANDLMWDFFKLHPAQSATIKETSIPTHERKLNVALSTDKNELLILWNDNIGKLYTQINIYDALGKVVFNQAISNNQTELSIHCNTFPVGLYIINLISSSGEKLASKMVINR